MNNDNTVETAIAGLNCWPSYATACHTHTLIDSPLLVRLSNINTDSLVKVSSYSVNLSGQFPIIYIENNTYRCAEIPDLFRVLNVISHE